MDPWRRPEAKPSPSLASRDPRRSLRGMQGLGNPRDLRHGRRGVALDLRGADPEAWGGGCQGAGTGLQGREEGPRRGVPLPQRLAREVAVEHRQLAAHTGLTRCVRRANRSRKRRSRLRSGSTTTTSFDINIVRARHHPGILVTTRIDLGFPAGSRASFDGIPLQRGRGCVLTSHTYRRTSPPSTRDNQAADWSIGNPALTRRTTKNIGIRDKILST